MKVTENQSSDMYAIQTLYDGKWVPTKNFIQEDEAQVYASKLVPDWGSQRVRILFGKYDAVEDCRRFSEVSIVPPKSTFQIIFDKSNQLVWRILQTIGRRYITSSLVAGSIVGILLIAVSALTSFPSLASNEQEVARNTEIASVQAPIAKSIRDIFKDLTANQYGKLNRIEKVPVRLQGDWSQHCASGNQDLQLLEHTFTEFDGALSKDTELQLVFQSGQTYGLVAKDGTTHILEMLTIDQIKIVGHLSIKGQFVASSKNRSLQRCL